MTPRVKADTWINAHEKCDKNSRPLCNARYLFLFFHGLLVRIFQHSYLTTSEYTQLQTDLHIQTNKEKRGSCNPQYVLISIADIKSLQNFHVYKNICTMSRCKSWLVNVIWCILFQKMEYISESKHKRTMLQIKSTIHSLSMLNVRLLFLNTKIFAV